MEAEDGSKMVKHRIDGLKCVCINIVCIYVYNTRSLRQRHLSMPSAHDDRDRMMLSAPLL